MSTALRASPDGPVLAAQPASALTSRYRQCGASTLLAVTALVTLAAVSAAMGVRSLWLERLGSDNRALALQARLAAESALARAASQLQQAARQGDLGRFWSPARASDCPASHPPPGWECRRLDWPEVRLGGRAEPWQLQALAVRHLTRSPHVVELMASARQGVALAQVGHSLYQPALAPLPAGAVGTPGPADASCAQPAWVSALGAQTEAALRQLSDSQARAGLDAHSTPPRSIYWVDSPQPWHESLGQPGQAVLLVFSRQACAGLCPRLLAGTQVHGTVVFDAGCNTAALPLGAPGQIEGQVSGLLLGPPAAAVVADPGAGTRITPNAEARQALDLHWPEGIDAREVQWVAGSWHMRNP